MTGNDYRKLHEQEHKRARYDARPEQTSRYEGSCVDPVTRSDHASDGRLPFRLAVRE
jgi:hypothetical protein